MGRKKAGTGIGRKYGVASHSTLSNKGPWLVNQVKDRSHQAQVTKRYRM